MNANERRLMVKAGAAIRNLCQEKSQLRERLDNLVKQAAAHERFEKAGQVIGALVERGHISQPGEVLPKLAELMKKPSEELDVLLKAASLSSAGFTEMALVSDEPSNSDPNAKAAFAEALLGS